MGGLAVPVLESCAGAGISEFCVCAGARNVELVVALERSSGCRLWHFFDERSAAFFALGRMMRTGRPVAVVTTSGTAVAELLPATVEAHYQGLPLVLLSADRPAAFRGTGAPQAIEQVGIFSGYARCLDLSHAGQTVGMFLLEAISDGCPAQVNLCLEEPAAEVVAGLRGVDFPSRAEPATEQPSAVRPARTLERYLEQGGDALLVMLGNLRTDERVGLRAFLERLGAPVVAEAGSGLRERLPGLIVREAPGGIRRVLRIGGVPSARFWRDLESRPEIEVASVSRTRHPGLARRCEVLDPADWREVTVRNRGFSEPLVDVELGPETRWLRALSERIPEGSSVLIGNSLPIREWNQAATFTDRRLQCFSCRGANGIDGALSAFFGLSVDAEESWAIVGDLTAMYDLSAPWALRELGEGRRRIVVINNGGGRIFSKLPALAGLSERERRAIENDHPVNLEGWAAMWGMDYLRAESEDELRVADAPGAVVLEIFVSEQEQRDA